MTEIHGFDRFPGIQCNFVVEGVPLPVGVFCAARKTQSRFDLKSKFSLNTEGNVGWLAFGLCKPSHVAYGLCVYAFVLLWLHESSSINCSGLWPVAFVAIKRQYNKKEPHTSYCSYKSFLQLVCVRGYSFSSYVEFHHSTTTLIWLHDTDLQCYSSSPN